MQVYEGSADYCYANAAAMLLAAAGETVPPALIECLSAVGIGATLFVDRRELFFSQRPPDLGISGAFAALGFEVEETAGAPGDPLPLERLHAVTERAPLMIGPLDMGHLRYLPRHEMLGGADHYVLVIEPDEGEGVLLHDPKGYPNVRLGLAELEAAWRARAVSYRRGPFRSWSRPRRRERPGRSQLVERCLDACRAAAAWTGGEARTLHGQQAIEHAARLIEEAASPMPAALLTEFGLPLGARRSHDLSVFLAPNHPGPARIKQTQSRCFMACRRHLLAGGTRDAAETLHEIGRLEEAFITAITGAPAGQPA